MASYVLAPNKAYPSIPTISGTLENHTLVLGAMQESMAIYERRTGNAADSFVRLSELEDLGIINIDQTTNIVVAPDDDGVFIRRDGTSSATTGEIDIGAGLKLDEDTAIKWGSLEFLTVSSQTGEPTTSDAYYGSVTFLATFEGATAGAETFTPEIGPAFEWRATGGTQPTQYDGEISTAQATRGTQSIYAKEVSGAPSAGWQTTAAMTTEKYAFAGDFTIEFDFYAVNLTSGVPALYIGDYTDYQWKVEIDSAAKLTFSISQNGTTWTSILSQRTFGGGTFQLGQWYHIAITRSGNDWYGFVDGTPVDGTTPYTAAVTVYEADDPYLCIMQYGKDDGAFNMEAYMDNIRITDGVARYTGAFTPDTLPFQGTPTGFVDGAFTVGDPTVAMEIDATGVNLDTSVPISWNDIDFLVFDTTFAPGSEPVTDPYFGFVTCLVTAEEATVGAATFTSDIGDITWTWVGDNTEGTAGEWGYPTDESAKHGTMSIFTRGSGGATFEGFGGPAQNSAEAVAAFPLNEGTTNEWCVDFWFDPAPYNGGVWFNPYYVINSYNTQNAGIASFSIEIEANSGRASMIVPNTSTNRAVVISQAGDIISNFEQEGWHHYAFTRESDGEFRCYIDGVLKQRSGTGIYGSMASVNIQTPANSQVLVWGGSLRNTGPNGVSSAGYVDSFRVTKGSARYYDGGAAVGTDIFGTTIDTDAGVPQGTPGTIGFKVGDDTLAYPTDIYGLTINLKNPVTAASTVDITGAVTMASTLGVTGAVTMSSTLGVTGAVTMSSTLGVTGATTLSDTLGVTGATTLSSTLAVTGISTFNSDVVLDAGTNTATWSSDDTDLTLTSVGLTDYDITGFTAINVDTTMGIEWGDTEYLAFTAGAGGGSGTGDPYFHLVPVLIDGEGANGATTLSTVDGFGDSLTFVGNAQISTAQFKFGTSSLLFDGAGDYVSLPVRQEHQLENGYDMTIEGWMRFDVSPAAQMTLACIWGATAAVDQWWVGWYLGGLKMYIYSGGAPLVFSQAWTPSIDTWYHIAFVIRDENGTNTVRAYVDGTELGTGDTTINAYTPQAVTNGTAGFYVGGYPSTGYHDGYIDDVRITKGFARYTANFTAPTAAFETIGQDDGWNSVVFSCDFDGADAATSATDDSNSAHALTFVGNAQLDTATVKSGTASLLCDGTGDYLTAPHSSDFLFGAEDFTVEGHFNFSSNTTADNLIAFWDATTNNRCWMCRYRGDLATDSLDFTYSTNGTGGVNTLSSAWTPTTGQWYHLAWVRDGDTMRFFVDGVAKGTVSLAGVTLFAATAGIFSIGSGKEASGFTNEFHGSIDNVRVTKGVARYRNDFSPPVVNATIEGGDADYASVVALLRFEGVDAAITTTDESASAHTFTFNGNAQIDTAESHEGASSLLLDGTGDYLSTTNSDDWDFGSGDFTVEGWYRWNADSGDQTLAALWDSVGTSDRGWLLYYRGGSNLLSFFYSTDGIGSTVLNGSSFTPTLNTWYHIALVRDGATIRFFIDGVPYGTGNISTNSIFDTTCALSIGALRSGGGWTSYFNGWVDDFRVTKGVARYTTDFSQVPPPVTYQTSAGGGGGTSSVFHVGEATSALELLGTSVTMAGSLVITDATEVDSVTFDHDGTDFNMTFVTTTNWNITGITSIQAGTVSADFDAITATSYGGITEANLVDKTAVETISGDWTFSGTLDVSAATFTGLSSDDLSDVASIAMLDEAETVTGAWTFSSEIQLTPQAAPTHTEGLVWYDSTEKALSYYNEEADVTINLGQENVIRVRNVSGALIPNGSAVYISGATGASLPNIDLARADALSTAECIGLVTHDIENNSNGYVTTLGLVRDLDTSSFSAGAELFLDVSTAGAWTATKPVSDYCVPIGYVTVSNVSVGEIKVTMHPEADRGDLTSASQDLTISGDWTFAQSGVAAFPITLEKGGASNYVGIQFSNESSVRRWTNYISGGDNFLMDRYDSSGIWQGSAFRIDVDSGKLTLGSILENDTGNQQAVNVQYTVNKLTSGDDVGIFLNKTDTSSPGSSWLMDLQVGGVSQFNVQDDGVSNFVGEVIASHYAEESSSPSSASNAITFDIANGAAFETTLTENITSITISNPPTTGNHAIVTIKFIQDATGSWTVSGWPASVKWPGGTAPTITTTLSTGTDIIILETWDAGTTWYGRFFQDYQ